MRMGILARVVSLLAVVFLGVSGVVADGSGYKEERPSYERQSSKNVISAPEWTLDPAHTSVSFRVKHLFTPVQGVFEQVEGSIHFDPDNLEGSSVDIRIPVSSVNTRNAKRDAHLQTEDFFDAKKYPYITFKGDRFVKLQGNNRYAVVGDFTIRDVTRRIQLPFTLIGIADHPMKKGHRVAGVESELVIDRTEFGVGSGDFAATTIIGDEVKISLLLEAVSK